MNIDLTFVWLYRPSNIYEQILNYGFVYNFKTTVSFSVK